MDCFVIMPFSNTNHIKNKKKVLISKDEWDCIYKNWIKRAVENYPDNKINCIRSKSVSGNFIKGIINDLNNSAITIADLTGQRPNVYYELGIRHALKLGTIIITQNFNALPSDLASYYCFEYNYSNIMLEYEKLYKEFEMNLHEKIKYILENPYISDNPVSDFLQLKHYYSVARHKEQLHKFIRLFDKIIEILNEYYKRIEELISEKEHFINDKALKYIFVDTDKINMYFQVLLVNDWDEIKNQLIEDIIDCLGRLRGLFKKIDIIWNIVVTDMNSENIKMIIQELEHMSEERDGYMSNLINLRDYLVNSEDN